MTKVTDEALKRFAAGHIGGLNTEAMAKEILELRAENARLDVENAKLRELAVALDKFWFDPSEPNCGCCSLCDGGLHPAWLDRHEPDCPAQIAHGILSTPPTQAENARLREQNDIAVHFVRWVIQWESDPDVKSLAQYMIDNAKLTLKEINKSTPPSQAENARLREAIESQPHSWDCATQVPPESPCDCWKSRALENVSKSSESK